MEGREKRAVSSMIHKYSLDLLEDKDDINYLIGILSFINDIEPIFIERMILKYGKDCISNLIGSGKKVFQSIF